MTARAQVTNLQYQLCFRWNYQSVRGYNRRCQQKDDIKNRANTVKKQQEIGDFMRQDTFANTYHLQLHFISNYISLDCPPDSQSSSVPNDLRVSEYSRRCRTYVSFATTYYSTVLPIRERDLSQTIWEYADIADVAKGMMTQITCYKQYIQDTIKTT